MLSELSEGDFVRFSGRFLPDDSGPDHLEESSLTERGSMMEPEFLMVFEAVERYESG